MYRTLLLLLILFHLAACSSIPFLGKDKNGKNVEGQKKEPVVTVVVNGVDEPVARNIRAHVGLTRTRCSVPVDLLKRRSNKTREEARAALEAFGYYEAQTSVNFTVDNECPVAEINVEPGRRMKITRVDLVIEGEAADDSEFNNLLRDLPIEEGTDLNHGNYSNTKSQIESAAAELGYLDGRFTTSKLKINMDNYSADAVLHFQSGERYRLGEITINQDPPVLREKLVRRLLEAPVGEKYRADQLVQLQDRLGTSSYFDRVEARPQLSGTEDKKIPVEVNVTPSKRHHFSASYGFVTDEGFRSRLAYTNRWWNDRGHRLGAETRLSQSEQGVSANYQIPREYPSNEWLRLTTSFRQRDVDTFETREGRIAVNESKRRPWGIMENRFIALSHENFDIGNESGTATFLVPGVRWNRRVVDNELYPDRGLDLSLEVRGATETIVSDTSFFRSSFHAHYLRTLGLGFRASLRGDIGAMWVDAFRSLPPDERFFTGGDNSIRGYDYQELGPVNDSGHVIGGQYLGVASFELEKYLNNNWGIAAFVDTGNAFGGPGSNTGLKTGVGAGIRWRSPVGPVRVDVAHPLDDDNDSLFRIHLRIGPDL